MVKYPMRTRIVGTHTLGTLTTNNAVVAVTRIDANRLNGCTIRKARYNIDIKGKTADEGPLLYGLSVGLTVTEIGGMFTADPQSKADEDEEDKSQRHAVFWGVIPKTFVATATDNMNAVNWRNGKWPGWDIIEGQAIETFVLNVGAQLTTGTVVTMVTEFLGDWRND